MMICNPNFTHLPFTAIALAGLVSVASAQELSEQIPTAQVNVVTATATHIATKDQAVLRVWFQLPQFNISDGLDDYDDDYRFAATLPKGRNSRRVRLKAPTLTSALTTRVTDD